MDAPKIQYTKATDGVDIAFYVTGSGPPLVICPTPPGSHLQAEREIPAVRDFLENTAERATVIRYDCRGFGMSDRSSIDFSSDAICNDLSAVVDRLGLTTFAILGNLNGSVLALEYARVHPERVSRLALWPGVTTTNPIYAKLLSILETNILEEEWEFYTNLRARIVYGWDSPNAAPLAEALRLSCTPESFRAIEHYVFEKDWASLAKQVTVPALIIHSFEHRGQSVRARLLASTMPNAHLFGVPGETHSIFPTAAAISAIHDFVGSLGPVAEETLRAPILNTNSFRTILFTDIESHTQMMQRLGDTKGREVLREHERITREALAAHGGSEVKTMGDGFMASFGSAQKAIECAQALQRAFTSKEGEAIRVRVGINAGEPIAEDDDLFGSSVILAARTAAKANGGEILVTDVVRQLVAGKGFVFADRGETEMRGFEEPVRLFEVRWQA